MVLVKSWWNMTKKIIKLDPKYVTMLEKSYEKYSKLEVVNSSFEHFNDSAGEDSKKLNKCKGKVTSSPTIQNESQAHNKLKRKKAKGENKKSKKIRNLSNINGHKTYSEEEIEIILKFLETNPDFDLNKTAKIKELAKMMKGRTFSSIDKKIRYLQLGLVGPKKT